MKNKKYRAAVVGCGKIGVLFEAEKERAKPASHAGAIAKNSKTELVALVDTNGKNLAAAGVLYPAAARYASLAECLKNEKLDIVVIATPPSGRPSLIKECVKAKIKMIVCEKPLAVSVREANSIKASLGGLRTTFVLNYQRRFSPLFKRVKEDIQKGVLGPLVQIQCSYSNGLFNNGGHIIDALQYLTGDRITSVHAVKNTRNVTHPNGDMNVDAILVTEKGITITLQSFDQNAYAIHDICLMGTKGAISITNFGQQGIWWSAKSSQFSGLNELSATPSRKQKEPLSATRDALGRLIECYEFNSVPESGIENGIAVLRVLEALKKSANGAGKRVLVE